MAFQAFSFGVLGSELQCHDAILVLLLVLPYLSSTWKTMMVALCLSLSHTLTFNKAGFNKIKQLFLSPFIFTQLEKDENTKEIDSKF